MDPPILSEYNGLALQAGGKLLLQSYAFAMLASKGMWDDSRLIADIHAQEFSAIVVDAVNRGRWTPGVRRAMEAAYRVEGEYWLYRHIGATKVQLMIKRPGYLPASPN